MYQKRVLREEAFPCVPRLRAGLFCDLSLGEFCPLRIPFDRLRAAVSPTDKTRHRGPNAVGDFAEPERRGKVKTAPSYQSLQERLHP
jgi:hypothetical protein